MTPVGSLLKILCIPQGLSSQDMAGQKLLGSVRVILGIVWPIASRYLFAPGSSSFSKLIKFHSAGTGWSLFRDSSRHLWRFLKLILFIASSSLALCLARSSVSPNSDLYPLDSMIWPCSIWDSPLCSTVWNLLPGVKLRKSYFYLVCFLFLRDHSVALPFF